MITRWLHRNYRASSSLKSWLQRRFSPAGVLVIFSAFLSGSIGVDTNQAVAYQTSLLLWCLLLFSISWSFFRPPKLIPHRVLPRVGTAGTPLHYRLSITNPTRQTQYSIVVTEDFGDPRPTYREFALTPEPGEASRNLFDRFFRFYRWIWLMERKQIALPVPKPLPALVPGKTEEVPMEIIPKRRGRLHLRGLDFIVPDPFGLCRSHALSPLPESILILPRRYLVPELQIGAGMRYHPGGVSMASSLGESEEFMSVREYRRGDPLRHIHWKSTSKTGKLIVKEFQNEFFVRHALILDTFLRDSQSPVFEEAVSVAASFAFTLNSQESLLDLLFVGTTAYCVTAGHGVASVEHMLEILSEVQPCTTASFQALEEIVLRQISLVSGCVCIFLEWDEQRKALVEQISVLEVPLLVLVITAPGQPKPKADLKTNDVVPFYVLEAGRVQEDLAKIK